MIGTLKKPRILLADDHKLVAEGFRRMLTPDFDVVGAVEDGRSLLEVAQKLEPDVVLMDISMPLLNGIDAARRLKKLMPAIKVIFVTMHANPAYVAEAFRAGASGYLLKQSATSELVFAIREALQGLHYVTPIVAKDVLIPLRGPSLPSQPGKKKLTPRQREVLQLVAEGRSLKEIADILKISVKTVEFHKSRIMNYLGVRTTADLTKYAIVTGLVTTD